MTVFLSLFFENPSIEPRSAPRLVPLFGGGWGLGSGGLAFGGEGTAADLDGLAAEGVVVFADDGREEFLTVASEADGVDACRVSLEVG